jgi:hypothetical protein
LREKRNRIVKEIIIVSEDRPGLVADISTVLAEAEINIEFLSAEIVGGTAITILSAEHYDVALRALSAAGFHALTEDAIVVRLDDKPGELARITRRFKEAGISLRSIRIIRRDAGQSIVALSAPRTQEAMELVKDVLITP